MALFTRGLYDSDPSFTSLFRLLDEYDNYNRDTRTNSSNPSRHQARHQVSTFNPKFDVRETDNAYELHGELPGIEREKIDISFTDPQTLVIRGRTERNYTAGTPPAQQAIITEKGGDHAESASPKDKEPSGAEKNNGNNNTSKGSFEKYWVQERSIGEFARTFSFPSRVDQDAVSAKLNNGVLSLTVPKAKKLEARRIAIN